MTEVKWKKKICVHRLRCTLTLILHRMVLSESVIFKKDASLKYFPEDNIFFLFLLFRHLHFAFPLNYATRFTRKNAIYNLGRQFWGDWCHPLLKHRHCSQRFFEQLLLTNDILTKELHNKNEIASILGHKISFKKAERKFVSCKFILEMEKCNILLVAVEGIWHTQCLVLLFCLAHLQDILKIFLNVSWCQVYYLHYCNGDV